jgi:hypothetical protein
MLAFVLGLEWTVPLGEYAQPNQESASAPAASVGTQEVPPIQETAVIEEPKPFYKKWWFWAIVVIAIVVSAVAIAAADSDGDAPIGGPPAP